MNKKILLPIIAVAVIIPILGATMITPDADKIGKEFAANHPGATIGVSTLEGNISEQEEVNRAQLIIEGTITEIKPFWKLLRADSIPNIYTEYTVKVTDVVKGNVQVDDTISVLMSGGMLDGVTSKTTAMPIQLGDNVIMLLGKDIYSIWGESYHPISVSKSTYLLEDETAKNKLESRIMDKTDLKEKLTRLSSD